MRRGGLSWRLGSVLIRRSCRGPVVAETEADGEDSEIARLRSDLLSTVPTQPSERTPEQAAVALLADLLEWHRRENKPAWWRYFYVRTLSSSDLVAEPDALGLLSGGEVVGSVKKSVLRRFSFPPQEHKFGPLAQAADPITGRGFVVDSVDDAQRRDRAEGRCRATTARCRPRWSRLGRLALSCKPSGCAISALGSWPTVSVGATARLRF